MTTRHAEDSHQYLEPLSSQRFFSRKDLHSIILGSGIQLSEASFKLRLQELLSARKIVRVGRNAYCVPDDGLLSYHHSYTDLAKEIVGALSENHPHIDFMMLELTQLNEFVNHLIANNTFFVSVDSSVSDFVFNTLRDVYPGKVMINPKLSMFHQYWTGDMIVIRNLVSEAPRDRKLPWGTKLEKLLVDIVSDPLIRCSVNSAEYPMILEEAFRRYVVDESCLLRYARRRNADKKIRQLLENETSIRLRTGD